MVRSSTVVLNIVTGNAGNYIGQSTHFYWTSQSDLSTINGLYWIQTEGIPFLEQAYEYYFGRLFQVSITKLPTQIPVSIQASSNCVGGVSGLSGGTGLRFCAGIWAENADCYGILSHELANIFTGQIDSFGWPVAWWADDRSPFPTVASNMALQQFKLQYYLHWGNQFDPLVEMDYYFFLSYPSMWSAMFNAMLDFHVQAPAADPELSNVIYYFMFYGAQHNLSSHFVTADMPPVDSTIMAQLESQYGLGVLNLPAG